MDTLDPSLSGSEPEQTQAEIRRLTDLTQALMAATGEMGFGVVLVDGQQVLYANDMFCELSGYTIEELVALPSFFNLVPDDERRILQERMGQRLMGAAVEDHYATTFHHRQGHLISLEAVVKVAHLDGRPHVIAIVRDVSL